MTSIQFERWVSIHPSSTALTRFREDFTSLNDYYWGSTASLRAVSGKVRHLSSKADFRQELGLTNPQFLKPLGHSVTVFANQVKTSEKWHRRAVLVLLASAFERYLTDVTRLAFASNPTLGPAPHLLDGLALFKHNVQLAQYNVEDVTKGTWSARYSAYTRFFGSNKDLDSSISVLDKLRNDRNTIAHTFASEYQPHSSSSHADLLLGVGHAPASHKQVMVSENRIVELLGTIHRLSESIDLQLLTQHIGSFEIAALYLEWEKDPQKFEARMKADIWRKDRSKEQNAKRFLTYASSANVGLEYVRSMINYLTHL